MNTIDPSVTGKRSGKGLEPLVVRPKTAMQLLDCSRPYLYELINAGEFETFKDGRARKITMRSIHERIERKLRQSRQHSAA